MSIESELKMVTYAIIYKKNPTLIFPQSNNVSYRVCLVPHFTQKFLSFGPSLCKMELNTMQNF
jgi:hypothetical protein